MYISYSELIALVRCGYFNKDKTDKLVPYDPFTKTLVLYEAMISPLVQ